MTITIRSVSGAGCGSTAAIYRAISPTSVVSAVATATPAPRPDTAMAPANAMSRRSASGVSVVVVRLPVEDQGAVYGRLYEDHRIAGAPRGGEFPGVRFCPHVYNTMAEIERVADALAAEV